MKALIDKLRREAEQSSLVCAMRLMKWRSYGKDGKGPAKLTPLTELDTDHLRNILRDCRHIRGTDFETAIRTMLEMP